MKKEECLAQIEELKAKISSMKDMLSVRDNQISSLIADLNERLEKEVDDLGRYYISREVIWESDKREPRYVVYRRYVTMGYIQRESLYTFINKADALKFAQELKDGPIKV